VVHAAAGHAASVKRPAALLAAACLAALIAPSCGGTDIDRFLADLPAGGVVALANVTVVDGTGQPARDDQTIVIQDGRITAIGPASEVRAPAGAKTLELAGRSVIPGLVGMHNHLFYHVGGGDRTVTAQENFAMLYLASGVTTIRTAGAVDFDGDLRLKRLVDEGKRPGPTIHVTGPYLHAQSESPDPDRVARDVAAWADRGATSIKAYMTLRRDELKAAIDTAHARQMKVTGHLCAVGFQEAAALGIDNLEHGLLADAEFASNKQPDLCPDSSDFLGPVQALDVSSPALQRTISALVRRGTALTSTLAVYETFTSRAQLDPRTLHVLAPPAVEIYKAAQARNTPDTPYDRGWSRLLRKEMEFERAFVAAGGRLIAGVDPTGWGGIVAGFGDQRQLELLVDAGFSPEAAIRIATLNGAAFLNEAAIGYLGEGMQADLVVVGGDLSKSISNIRNVEVVFKKGVGYNPDALVLAAQGTVGKRDLGRYLRSPYAPLALLLLVLLVGRRVWRAAARKN
jgi:imidazolonepropionase-like amidohydrolase